MNFKTKQITSPLLAVLWILLLGIIISVVWLFGYNNEIISLSIITSVLFLGLIPLKNLKTPTIPTWFYGFMALIVVGASIVLFLGRVPVPPNYDEALLAIWANDFYKTGNPILSTHTIQTPYYSLYPLGVLLTTLGTSFVNARLSATLLTILSLVPLYFLLVRHFGKSATLFVLVYGVIIAIQQSYFRMDVLVPLSVAIGMLCYNRANGRLGMYILSGFAFASALEAHPIAVGYGVALGLVCSVQYIQQILQGKGWKFNPFWGVLIGGILFMLVYFAIRTLGAGISLNEYILRLNSAFQAEETIGQNLPFTERFPMILFGSFYVFMTTFPLNFLIVSAGMVLSRRIPKLQLWLVVLVVGNIVGALINPKHSIASYAYYTLHSLPIVLFILAGITQYVMKSLKSFAYLTLMFWVILFSWVVMYRQQFDYNGTEQIQLGYEINNLLPPEVNTVMGWETYYWGLEKRQFYMSSSFVSQNYTVQERLNLLNLESPQAIILTYDLDNRFGAFANYLAQNNFERVQCYEIRTMDLTAELYVLPTILPDIRDEGCS
jgi:hypothetical protein